MVRYILRTVYNSVFRHDDSSEGSFKQSMSHLNTKFVIMPDWSFLAVFCTMFSVKAKTVSLCLGDSQTSL